MPAPRFVRPLDAPDLAALQQRYRTTNDADERSRCQMILFSARGKSVPEIAELTLFEADTVLYWIDRYETEGLEGLATKARSGRPPKSRYHYDQALVHAVESAPRNLSQSISTWTCGQLATYLAQLGHVRVCCVLACHEPASSSSASWLLLFKVEGERAPLAPVHRDALERRGRL